MIDYKELLCGHLKEMYGNADVLQKRWEPSRVQARNRPNASRDMEHTPAKKIRNQNHDEMRPPNSSQIETGDTE